MPPLRTDDGPRKLRAVWLGPKGATLPFEWTYVQWSVTLLAVPLAAALAVLLVRALGGPSWLQLLATMYGAVSGVYLAVRAMRNVTFDEPLKHKTGTVRAELSRRHRRPTAQSTVWVWQQPTITDLTPEAAQLLIPRTDT